MAKYGFIGRPHLLFYADGCKGAIEEICKSKFGGAAVFLSKKQGADGAGRANFLV